MTPAASKLRTWRENPVQFVVDNFGGDPEFELEEWQREALMAVGGEFNPRRRLAMKSCTGAGKSAVLAWIGWHRLSCFAGKGEHPKGAALSGEGKDNLRDNLWAELSKWQERSGFLTAAFQWQQERIYNKAHPQTWFLSARSYPKDADTEAIGRSLSGLHSKYPFVLLDEKGDMPVAVGQKAAQIYTGAPVDALIAGAGNPTSTDGLLYHVATIERALWALITITADPDDPKRTKRVDIEHAREQIKLYGRDNPWIMATILGLFPPRGFNTLLSVDEVEAAMNRQLNLDDYQYAQRRLGVDVARFGDDRTIIFPRQGLNGADPEPIEMRNQRSHDVAARAMAAKMNWSKKGTHDILIMVDGTGGHGAGVVDSLLQAGQSSIDVQAAGKAIDSRFYNKRAECWWLMAEWVKRGGALPKLPGLVKELTTPKYSFQKGAILIEPKDKLKERLKISPDMADALAQTFALPDMPAELAYPNSLLQKRGTALPREYDPFAER